MAKVRNKGGQLTREELLERASRRCSLPNVPLELDYQDDVDTLVVRFKGQVSPSILPKEEYESGVIGIYRGEKLVGVEILDITGQLKHADPR